MKHEPVIIGGGPAGAAAAISLARAGMPVCLLERKTGPHHKVCGEFISWEAAQYLEQLGIDLPMLGAQPVRRVRLYSGERTLGADLPATAWSLSRRTLDAALLQRAEAVGARVRLGAVVRDLRCTDTIWRLTVADLARRELHELTADTVFLASGKHDIRHWRRSAPASSPSYIGLKMHLQLNPMQRDVLREAVEIYLFDGGYAGLELVEEGEANLCFLLSKEIYSTCDKHWPSVFNWLTATSPHLQARLDGAQYVWQEPLAISGVPYGYLHSAEAAMPGLFRLGDQTAVIPSLAGDGIAIALHSGLLAAATYSAGGDSDAYQQQALKDFKKPVRHAQLIARIFSREIGRKAAFSLSRLMPSLVTSAICSTRTEGVV